jgi:hypothetical protein
MSPSNRSVRILRARQSSLAQTALSRTRHFIFIGLTAVAGLWLAAVSNGQDTVAKRLTKMPKILGHEMECTPVVYKGQYLMLRSHRVDTPRSDVSQMYLMITDGVTGKEQSRFGRRHTFLSALVEGDVLHVWATEYADDKAEEWPTRENYHFWTTDLKTWNRELALRREGDEHICNTSVCRDEKGYLMAYDSDQPVKFCIKFARSRDLRTWEKIKGLVFAGVDGKEYSACTPIRYIRPYYYLIYLHAPIPGHNGWVAFMARSEGLAAWQLSPRNPVLEAGPGEGCNNSDVDLIEQQGRTYLNYAAGNQNDWCDLRQAIYPGSMKEFFESYFPAGAAMLEVNATRGE